jgi:hypothetical protein
MDTSRKTFLRPPHFESYLVTSRQAQNASSWQKCGNGNKTNEAGTSQRSPWLCSVSHAQAPMFLAHCHPAIPCDSPQLPPTFIAAFNMSRAHFPHMAGPLLWQTVDCGPQNLRSYSLLNNNAILLLFMLQIPDKTSQSKH